MGLDKIPVLVGGDLEELCQSLVGVGDDRISTYGEVGDRVDKLAKALTKLRQRFPRLRVLVED